MGKHCQISSDWLGERRTGADLGGCVSGASVLRTLLVFVFTFTWIGAAGASPPDRATEEMDIREATFRYQFDKNESGLQRSAYAYYLSIPGKDGKRTDPPGDFMKRFAGNKHPVKMISECTPSADRGVIDKKTGKRGLIFHTGAIKWISDTEVEVSGGYYEGGLSSSGSTYHLKQIGGKWQVSKDVMHWIS